MERYAYKSLLPGPNSIRLLQLLPGDDKAEIRCRISDHYLIQEPLSEDYEALSYVWGDPNVTRRILLEAGDQDLRDGLDQELLYLEVTVNLHTALLHLRRSDSNRLLWIDAICINQIDLAEREEQVQIMSSIFSAAKRVVVWLGGDLDDSITDINGVNASRQNDCNVLHQATDAGWEDVYTQEDWDSKFASFPALARRPWFQRIWVLQEVAVAQNVLFMCGKTELKDEFLRALSTIAIQDGSSADMHRPVLPIIELTQQKSMDQVLFPLGQLIDMFHTYEATDQRDKIYALLGISADQGDPPKIRPDYTRSWPEVLKQTISHIFGSSVVVTTQEDSSHVAIYSFGHVLGCITHVADKPKPNWLFVNSIHEQDGASRWTASCKVPTYAKQVDVGDLIYSVKGARRPCIVRPHGDHFDVIVSSLLPPLNAFDRDGKPIMVDWADLVDRSTINERHLLLLWDWESSEAGIGKKHEAILENFRVSSLVPCSVGLEERNEATFRRSLVQKVLEDVRNGPRDLQRYVWKHYGTWHRAFDNASTPMPIISSNRTAYH